jgi:regulatory protein
MRVPRKLETEAQLYAAALRALMRRAHSVHEMRGLLERRAADKTYIRPVLERLKQHKYLDDARYALDFARSHAQGRRQGRYRIARDLRARGVPDRHIEAALDTVFDETDEAQLVRVRLQRRLAHSPSQLDERKLASLYRSLLRAGFSSDVIRAELRAVTNAEIAELPAVPAEEEP